MNEREAVGHRSEWELPPPVEPFLSEQFSEDELNFYPSVQEPSADSKLVKIKQIFSKFKKENDRISSDYSRCSGSASLRDSVAYTYISKAPSQTSLQNTRRLFNEATQKSLFQKEQLNKPTYSQNAALAGMVRKKKAMSVVTRPSPSSRPLITGVLSIPKFLSISLQENAAALSFESEREAKTGSEIPTGDVGQNLFHSPDYCHRGTNTSIQEQEEYKEGDDVEDYVEKKKNSARILGGVVNSVLGKRLMRAFDSLRYFDPRESKVVYSCAVGVSYLLSSSLYQRKIEQRGRLLKRLFKRWKRDNEQPTTHLEEEELSPARLQLHNNLFGFVEETRLDEHSPVFRGETVGFGSFRD